MRSGGGGRRRRWFDGGKHRTSPVVQSKTIDSLFPGLRLSPEGIAFIRLTQIPPFSAARVTQRDVFESIFYVQRR